MKPATDALSHGTLADRAAVPCVFAEGGTGLTAQPDEEETNEEENDEAGGVAQEDDLRVYAETGIDENCNHMKKNSFSDW